MATLEEIKDELDVIRKVLMGNGKVGVAEMARRSFNWMCLTKASKNGKLDWVFRVGILIIMGFVAVKVGLK